MGTHRAGGLCHTVQQALAQVVEHHDAGPLPLVIDDGGGKSHHRLVRQLDIALLDVQVQGRDIDIPGCQAQCLGDIVATRLVLQSGQRHDRSATAFEVHPQCLPALWVDEAYLVVEPLLFGKDDKDPLQVGVRRYALGQRHLLDVAGQHHEVRDHGGHVGDHDLPDQFQAHTLRGLAPHPLRAIQGVVVHQGDRHQGSAGSEKGPCEGVGDSTGGGALDRDCALHRQCPEVDPQGRVAGLWGNRGITDRIRVRPQRG